MLHRVAVGLVGLVRLVVLAQQVLAVVVAVRGADDRVDVSAAGNARAGGRGHSPVINTLLTRW